MDPIAEVLQDFRLSGSHYCRSELRAPWGLEIHSSAAVRAFISSLRAAATYPAVDRAGRSAWKGAISCCCYASAEAATRFPVRPAARRSPRTLLRKKLIGQSAVPPCAGRDLGN